MVISLSPQELFYFGTNVNRPVENLTQSPFSRLQILQRACKSQTQDPQPKVPPGELYSGLLSPEEIHLCQLRSNP